MKKTRVLALALIVALVLLGAGYAAWNDTLTINTIANTGNLNVEFVDSAFNGTRKAPLFIKNLEMDERYLETDIKKDSPESITVTINKLYPGSGVLYDALLENKGTVPAVIDKVELVWDNHNQKLEDNLIVVGGFVQFRPGEILPVDGNIFPGTLNALFGRKILLKDLEKNLNDMLKGKTMEPGDYILFDIPNEMKDKIVEVLDENGIAGYDPVNDNCIIMGLPRNADNNLQKQEAIFTIKVTFKQHNA